MFVIVKVDQNYDYVEGVEFFAKFDTEEEANTRRQEIAKAEQEAGVARIKYVDRYVDAKIPVIPSGYIEYQQLCKLWFPKHGHIFPKDFKRLLKECLYKGYGYDESNPDVADFDPPKDLGHVADHLFVIEIK